METTESQPAGFVFSSSNKEANAPPTEITRKGNLINKFFQILFYGYFLLICILVIALTIRPLLHAHAHHFLPKKWYPPLLSSTAVAGFIGFTWQRFTASYPSKALKATFWISPLLTCGFGILLVSIGTPGGLAMSVITIVTSIVQALYACWVSPRNEHAIKILKVSSEYNPPKVRTTVTVYIIVSVLYSSFIMSGIGGSTSAGTRLDVLFITLMLISLSWTTQVMRNLLQVTVSHVKYMQFACGIEVDYKTVVKSVVKYSMGSICMGSVLVPVLTTIRGGARVIGLVSGDVDEFMFSCANCCSGLASRIVAYGNRWGFVHVGVYNKGIVQASMDTWDMFKRAGIMKLINSDLTSSFCFLSGLATGSICGLVGGTWTLLTHESYALGVSVYAFLAGYFMNRVAMAWVQASVSAYYVAYAENPHNEQFEFDTTIPAYVRELQRSQV